MIQHKYYMSCHHPLLALVSSRACWFLWEDHSSLHHSPPPSAYTPRRGPLTAVTCSSSRWDFLQIAHLVHFIVGTYAKSQKSILQMLGKSDSWDSIWKPLNSVKNRMLNKLKYMNTFYRMCWMYSYTLFFVHIWLIKEQMVYRKRCETYSFCPFESSWEIKRKELVP